MPPTSILASIASSIFHHSSSNGSSKHKPKQTRSLPTHPRKAKIVTDTPASQYFKSVNARPGTSPLDLTSLPSVPPPRRRAQTYRVPTAFPVYNARTTEVVETENRSSDSGFSSGNADPGTKEQTENVAEILLQFLQKQETGEFEDVEEKKTALEHNKKLKSILRPTTASYPNSIDSSESLQDKKTKRKTVTILDTWKPLPPPPPAHATTPTIPATRSVIDLDATQANNEGRPFTAPKERLSLSSHFKLSMKKMFKRPHHPFSNTSSAITSISATAAPSTIDMTEINSKSPTLLNTAQINTAQRTRTTSFIFLNSDPPDFLREEITRRQSIKQIPLPPLPPPLRLAPHEILFSVRQLPDLLPDGKLLSTAMDEFRSGSKTVADVIPLRIFANGSDWVTLDNRMLWILQEAGLSFIPVQVVDQRPDWPMEITKKVEILACSNSCEGLQGAMTWKQRESSRLQNRRQLAVELLDEWSSDDE